MLSLCLITLNITFATPWLLNYETGWVYQEVPNWQMGGGEGDSLILSPIAVV